MKISQRYQARLAPVAQKYFRMYALIPHTNCELAKGLACSMELLGAFLEIEKQDVMTRALQFAEEMRRTNPTAYATFKGAFDLFEDDGSHQPVLLRSEFLARIFEQSGMNIEGYQHLPRLPRGYRLKPKRKKKQDDSGFDNSGFDL